MLRLSRKDEMIFKKGESKIGLINIIAIIVVIGLAGIGGHFLGRWEQNRNTATQEVASVQTLAYDGEDGQNALDLLKAKADVQAQESSIGSFVTEINGTQNSEDHFWMFYVNDELAPVAADQYQTKNDDKIEWRYEAIQ